MVRRKRNKGKARKETGEVRRAERRKGGEVGESESRVRTRRGGRRRGGFEGGRG